LNQSAGESLKERLKRIGTLASIASYLIAGTISLFTFRSSLPDWLFFLLQIVIGALGLATVWVILGSSAKLRSLVFRERRKSENEERKKQDLREEFRVYTLSVKNWTDYYLWQALDAILRQGQGTEAYQSLIYGLLAKTSLTLGNIYVDFDPSAVSDDLLEHHRGKLYNLHYQLAKRVMEYASQAKSLGEGFSKQVSNMNDALTALQEDMSTRPA